MYVKRSPFAALSMAKGKLTVTKGDIAKGDPFSQLPQSKSAHVTASTMYDRHFDGFHVQLYSGQLRIN